MKKQTTNILIGAMVVIDYPSRWRGAGSPEAEARLRADTEASKKDTSGRGAYLFGEKGVIVNYKPDEESGKAYDVLLDSIGQVESIHQGEFTVTAMPKSHDQEIVAAVDSLTTAITGGNKLVISLLKKLVKQLEDMSVKPL
jgi:hypothetical protein